MATTEDRREILVEVVNQPVEVLVTPELYIEAVVEPPLQIQIETLPGGVVFQAGEKIGDLSKYASVYKEFSYSGANLIEINIWDTPDKSLLLINKTFSYTGNNLAQQIIQDYMKNKTLTLTYNYTGENLTSISPVIS